MNDSFFKYEHTTEKETMLLISREKALRGLYAHDKPFMPFMSG